MLFVFIYIYLIILVYIFTFRSNAYVFIIDCFSFHFTVISLEKGLIGLNPASQNVLMIKKVIHVFENTPCTVLCNSKWTGLTSSQLSAELSVVLPVRYFEGTSLGREGRRGRRLTVSVDILQQVPLNTSEPNHPGLLLSSEDICGAETRRVGLFSEPVFRLSVPPSNNVPHLLE